MDVVRRAKDKKKRVGGDKRGTEEMEREVREGKKKVMLKDKNRGIQMEAQEGKKNNKGLYCHSNLNLIKNILIDTLIHSKHSLIHEIMFSSLTFCDCVTTHNSVHPCVCFLSWVSVY